MYAVSHSGPSAQNPETTANVNRRDWLYIASTSLTGTRTLLSETEGEAAVTTKPKKVAAVVTAYAKGLHADVLLGKILEGWEQDGGPGPALELVSMYLDQFPEKDLAWTMSKKFGIPIFDTIEGAVTVGGNSIPVDGVISIGEHGRYPSNAKGQVLHPRRRFFEEITDAFRDYGRVVPDFNDRHLGRGAETGVKWVQCLQGRAMWKVLDEGLIPKATFDAALQQLPRQGSEYYVDMRESDRSTLFLFEYNDGLMGAAFMLPETIAGTSVALQLKGQDKPLATRFDERTEPSYPHFAWLLKGIERMFHTGQASYPAERTLLTSGILDRALTSLLRHQEKLGTPELGIRYQPVDYPHAPSSRIRTSVVEGGTLS